MKLTKIAFLDRDGVINSSQYMNGYIGSLKYFKWISGAIKTIRLLKKKKYKIVVVTNQSGVARGFFKIKDVKKIHSFIQKKLKIYNKSMLIGQLKSDMNEILLKWIYVFKPLI